MLSGVCFSGKHGIKANDRLGQKGQFNPKDSSTSPATAYLRTKGSYSPNTPMVAEHLWFDWMASGLVAHPTLSTTATSSSPAFTRVSVGP